MLEPRLLMHLALAVSIIGHLALTFGLLFAEARPYDPTPSEAIAVDIVAPEQAKPLPEAAEQSEPTPTEPKQAPIDFSALTAPVKPTTSQETPGREAPPQKPQAAAPASRPNPASAQQAAVKPQGSEALQPAQSPQAASAAPVPPAPPPDITVKYGVMLGLPAADQYGGVEAPAYDMTRISPDEISAFRRHLKTCSALPASIAPADKVKIVLRILLSRDGKLLAEPALLEASASAKGPALMHQAIDALQACQPYTMLPSEKYKEWRVLDLSFTPQDFSGG
jgi:hypothetical protein